MVNLSVFVERLKEYMNDYDLNETTLAKAIGCSRVTISNIINEAHMPSTETLIALTAYFKCSADYLLGMTDFPHEVTLKRVQPFNEILRTLLKENRKSQYNLRKELKISSSLVYKWLSGEAQPSVYSLMKLTSYFNCSVDHLLGRE
jgi:transcriptional regulator with XRE-family HTH domain